MTSILDRPGMLEPPAYRLPPEAYFDPTWYAREQRQLFARTWNMVGHVADVPEPGDYLTADVGTEPVVVVRTADGRLTGFVNVCRHRGMVIACDTGKCGGRLRCPYHGWEWDLDGDLTVVPQRKTQFPDLDAETMGLFPVAVATWAGFVFVHPDPTAAATFTEWLGDFPEHCGAYPWDELAPIARVRVPLHCNWKLYVENHIDWLHLWYLHADSLKAYEHHGAQHTTTGLHWYSAETLRDGEPDYEPDGVRPIPGVSAEERRTLRATLLFPNMPLSARGSIVQSYQVVPTGPETCALDLRVLATKGSAMTEQGIAERLRVARDEDGVACEQMQAAIRSSRFEVGPLALDYERPIADFHRNLLAFLD